MITSWCAQDQQKRAFLPRPLLFSPWTWDFPMFLFPVMFWTVYAVFMIFCLFLTTIVDYSFSKLLHFDMTDKNKGN